MSSGSGLDSSREAEKRNDLQKLSLEDLFDNTDEVQEQDVHDTFNTRQQKTDLCGKGKKVNGAVGSGGGVAANEDKEVAATRNLVDLGDTPATSSCEEMGDHEMNKEKQKVEENSRRAEGWVKLTAGKRENYEGKNEADETKRVFGDQNSGKTRKIVMESKKCEEVNKKPSDGKRMALSLPKGANVVKDEEVKKTSTTEKVLEGVPPFPRQSDGSNNLSMEKSKSVDFAANAEEQTGVVFPEKTNLGGTETAFGTLEEGELLPSPKKIINRCGDTAGDEKQLEHKDKANNKNVVERSPSNFETGSKERKKKDKELKLRKEREEIERLRKKQLEDEGRRAAYREQKRKKELEKEAREKEEREKRRKERLGRLEDKRKLERESDKRVEKECHASESCLKNKQDFSEVRGGNREKVSKAGSKFDSLLEESLFGGEKVSRKQREGKGKDVFEGRLHHK